MSNSWLPRMFNWIVPLLGGDFGVRFWHHLFLWFFVTFIIVHIYLAFYHDYIEGRGTVSSIIGGWKFDRILAGWREQRLNGLKGKVVLVGGASYLDDVKWTAAIDAALHERCRVQGEYRAAPDPAFA